MIGNYRFALARGGKGRFVGVTLRADAGAFEGVLWAPEAERFLQTDFETTWRQESPTQEAGTWSEEAVMPQLL